MVNPAERRWLWTFALVVMAVTTVPYLVGFTAQGSGWRFTGFVFGVEDGNSYLQRMLEGMRGSWLIALPNTGDPPHRFLALILYLLLGKLIAPPGVHEQAVALFHLARIAAGVLFIFATYDFLALFLETPSARRFGTALVGLGGGLGFLSLFAPGLFLGFQPQEFQTPESFGFYMIFGLPHLALARALVLWGLRGYLLCPERRWGWKTSIQNGLLWLAAGLMQPIPLIGGCAPIAAHLAWSALRLARDKRLGRPEDWAVFGGYFRRALVIALFAAPMVAYTFLAFRLDPFLAQWQAHNQFISPPVTDYLLAYGLALPLALLGIPRVVKAAPWRGPLVAGWLVIFPLLAYFPIGVQRRLPDGIWVAIVALALAGAQSLPPRVARWVPYGLGIGFISMLVLFAVTTAAATRPALLLFRPTAEVQAFTFIEKEVPAGSIVLGSLSTSNALPAWAPVRALTGHQIDTLDRDALHGQIACFYSTCTVAQRLEMLKTYRIAYVFWGPEERALGSWNPGSETFLKPLYENEGYAIYEVAPGSVGDE